MYGLRGGLGAEAMGPPVDPTLPVESPDVQQQIADIWDSIFKMGEPGGVMTPAPAPAPSAGAWLNQNAGKVAIGAAAFLALVMLAKAGR